MYQSPIEVYFKQAQEAARKVDEEVGNQIMIAVWDVGVRVDHDELIKALQYDRGQYEKGYADGKAAAEKHGEWYQKRITVPKARGHSYLVWACSLCNKHERKRSDFCPNCGAKMKG